MVLFCPIPIISNQNDYTEREFFFNSRAKDSDIWAPRDTLFRTLSISSSYFLERGSYQPITSISPHLAGFVCSVTTMR